MINTTEAYRNAIRSNREFRVMDKITFKDGMTITLSMADLMSYSINEATSASGKFEIGAAVIKEYSIVLNNADGKFDDYNFEDADVQAVIGLKLADGTWEDLQKGTYRIVSAKSQDLTIQITAYDSMLFFDKPYSDCTISYPATINRIISRACQDCHMTFDASTIEMGTYQVNKRPGDDALTYRDIISYCAQIMGCYARIDHLDQLSFGWYAFDALKKNLYGGVFDKDMPYRTGDSADGGNFTNYTSGYSYDAGTFEDMDDFYHFYDLKSQTINTDDVTITGVVVSADSENEKDKESVRYGDPGYLIELSDNPLIQPKGVVAVANHVGPKIKGKTFRPLSVSCQSDPSVESGDAAYITDRKQRTYATVITNTTFSLSGTQKIECSAETPTEKTYTKYSAETKILSESQKQTENQLSAYELASAHLGSLLAHSLGMYETTETDPNTGAKIKYMHDKPLLADSKTIWKQTVDAFAVSTDGGKTWKAGMDSSGNAVVNVLSAIGINADWITVGTLLANMIKGGTLTLGGKNNGSGIARILNEDDVQTCLFDKNGIDVIFGKIAGWKIDSNRIYGGNTELGQKTAVVQRPIRNNAYVFAAGGSDHSDYSDCPFRVMGDGTLYSKNGKFSDATIDGGSLTTTARDVVGFAKNNSVLKGGKFYIDSGDYQMADWYQTYQVVIDTTSNSWVGRISVREYDTTSMVQTAIVGGNISCINISQSSDRRKKYDIRDYDEYYEKLFDLLHPVRFKWKFGDDESYHMGYIAQDVLSAIEQVGLKTCDFGAYVVEDETDIRTITDDNGETIQEDYLTGEKAYKLNYTEFIPLNTHMIQKLKQENIELKKRVEALEKVVYGGE